MYSVVPNPTDNTSVETYLKYMEQVDPTDQDIYRYLNFDELPDFVSSADSVEISEEMKQAAKELGAQ